jgi:hypothetical protein
VVVLIHQLVYHDHHHHLTMQACSPFAMINLFMCFKEPGVAASSCNAAELDTSKSTHQRATGPGAPVHYLPLCVISPLRYL